MKITLNADEVGELIVRHLNDQGYLVTSIMIFGTPDSAGCYDIRFECAVEDTKTNKGPDQP